MLHVGYAKVNINPQLGTDLAGYYIPRPAKGFLDDLEAHAIVISLEQTKLAIVSVDTCYLKAPLISRYRAAIEAATGISADQLFLTATHTHTGPRLTPIDSSEAKDIPVIERYADFVEERLVDLIKLALLDLKPAKMGFITGYAPERVAYIRLYQMKDGSAMTCPPINDPNIDHPIGTLDQRMHILRFDREGGESIVLANYGLHADTVNGELLCSDWVGWMRRTLDKALDGVKCICLIGCQGDVGSTHVFPEGGDMNDTEISFDNEMKSPGMARFVGRALAGTVLQVYDKVEYVDVDELQILHRIIEVDSNRPTPEQLPLAHKYKALHEAGRDDEIPFTAMELTTVVAEATRMCNLEFGPDTFQLELTGIRLGPVALLGIPGEPFTDIGVRIKATEGFRMIMPVALCNGYEGYFPSSAAYAAGGYESRSSRFRNNVSDLIVDGSKKLLNDLK
ncbi:MAG: hypothetical protein E7470_04625 [Ruminococcaceae bacterium]|nr:hypothetical protein [Oscillospiraceae bacterium]